MFAAWRGAQGGGGVRVTETHSAFERDSQRHDIAGIHLREVEILVLWRQMMNRDNWCPLIARNLNAGRETVWSRMKCRPSSAHYLLTVGGISLPIS